MSQKTIRGESFLRRNKSLAISLAKRDLNRLVADLGLSLTDDDIEVEIEHKDEGWLVTAAATYDDPYE